MWQHEVVMTELLSQCVGLDTVALTDYETIVQQARVRSDMARCLRRLQTDRYGSYSKRVWTAWKLQRQAAALVDFVFTEVSRGDLDGGVWESACAVWYRSFPISTERRERLRIIASHCLLRCPCTSTYLRASFMLYVAVSGEPAQEHRLRQIRGLVEQVKQAGDLVGAGDLLERLGDLCIRQHHFDLAVEAIQEARRIAEMHSR